MTDTVVGIDLGTTFSLIGAVDGGEVRLFADEDGRELVPSVVGVDDRGRLLVGRAARNRRLIDPEGTVSSIKRKMGQDVTVRAGDRTLSPPQVSALVLGALLDRAEAALGHRPKRAVITVPAYFGDAQRQATRDAGELAGLVVERLVNEPTAAAVTYQSGKEERVLVYDLGGGTFDVSILERDEGFLEVRASRGDTQLGGDDLDLALVELILSRLPAREREKIRGSPGALARLRDAAERAKIALSSREAADLHDPYLAGEGADAVHLEMALVRADVEAVARPFIERTLTAVDAALRDARMRPSDLDRVLLVGGSSKMPLVGAMLSAHLERPAHADLDADRAVAMGASLLAGRLTGAEVAEVLVDITPHTLGVGVIAGDLPDFAPRDEADLDVAPVIPRDTVVPVERQRVVVTIVDDQEAVRLPIVQGEAPTVGGNTSLGEVMVPDLPPSPAGSPVEIRFRLDLSGILHVDATHLPSGRAQAVTIAHGPTRLSEQRRTRARAELDALRATAGAEAAPRATERELTLGRALVARAERVLSATPDPRAAALTRDLGAAIATSSGEVARLTDALADALVDLA